MADTDEDQAVDEEKEEADREKHSDEPDIDFDVSYQTEDLGPCYKKLTIQISDSDAQKSFSEAVEKLQQEVLVPGFRKGRAPRWLVERRFGKHVKEDLREKLVQGGLKQALTKSQIKLMGMPELDPELGQFNPDKAFEFHVKCFVRPEIQIDDYLGLEIELPDIEVNDDLVDNLIRESFRYLAKYADAPEGAAAEMKDIVTCDCQLTVEGALVWEQKSLDLLLTDRTRDSIVISELVDLAIGMKAGEEKVQTITLSDHYPEEKFRGKTGSLTVAAHHVKRLKYPEITDEIAKEQGFSGLEEVRNRVRAMAESNNKKFLEENADACIKTKLLEKANFELPDALVEKQVEEQVQEFRKKMREHDHPHTEEEIEKEVAEFKPKTRENFIREMKLTLVMQHICEKEGIKVDEGDVDDRISEIAKEENADPFDLREEYEAKGRLDLIRDQLLQERTFELLKRHVVVIKKEISEEKAQTGGTPPEGAASSATAVTREEGQVS